MARELEADVCWMTDQPLRTGGRYLVKHTTREVTAIVDELCDHVDVHTLERGGAPQELALERHRQGAPAHERAARVRPVRAEPPHRQLHPDRRGVQQHRRRRARRWRMMHPLPRQTSAPPLNKLPRPMFSRS